MAQKTRVSLPADDAYDVVGKGVAARVLLASWPRLVDGDAAGVVENGPGVDHAGNRPCRTAVFKMEWIDILIYCMEVFESKTEQFAKTGSEQTQYWI